jgi:hypothetical protein
MAATLAGEAGDAARSQRFLIATVLAAVALSWRA